MLYMARHGAPCKLTHPISCTASRGIAEEFARPSMHWPRGWVHEIAFRKGGNNSIAVVDVNAILGADNLAAREDEFVVLPGRSTTVWLHPRAVHQRTHRIEWIAVASDSSSFL